MQSLAKTMKTALSTDVVDLSSLEDAEHWAQHNRYVVTNVYRQVTVKTFEHVPP